jgi:hypothetical protein
VFELILEKSHKHSGHKLGNEWLVKLADVTVPGYQKFWKENRTTLRAEHQSLTAKYPDSEAQLKQLFIILGDIEFVAGDTPVSVGENFEWTSIVNTAEDSTANYCKAHTG